MSSLVEKTPVKKRITQSKETDSKQLSVIDMPEYFSEENDGNRFLNSNESDKNKSRINIAMRDQESEMIRFVERATYIIVFLGITPLILFYIIIFFFPDFLMIPASHN